ncbi:MAG TPA: 23S rRNA (adenine(2030)-N(6))-methyltransferase RlmJ [Methylophilaceae bacterium]|nr:23S rRNA (adenine(2030)-N(6))-methyltransferase RlmJ [Methylophilaceae bacterium]
MLSYRHAFHAGNHADVLKHYVLSLVLDYFNQKDKPYWYIDTHAGAGMYTLKSEFAQKNAEYETGIVRVMQAQNLPESLAKFITIANSFNIEGSLDFYPGSPKIAEFMLRKDDKLRLFELHPSDFKLLQENFKGKSKQANIEMQDGFSGIKAFLSPPTRRALVLIDPPYEIKEDYQHVVDCIKDSLKRFATGTYLIWYPLLQRPEPELMLKNLENLEINDWLNVSLTIEKPSSEGYGMHGSGMFVINPPWTLPKTLAEAMPILTSVLGLDANAHFTLHSNIT